MAVLRVLVVTTSRADYGLLMPLLLAFKQDPAFELLLVATGSHLDERHGHTLSAIDADGFAVAATVPMMQAGDTEADICRAIAQGTEGFSEVYKALEPDFVVVLGDRYELMAAVTPAVIHKIPVAHIHGGEVTQGAVDDSFRHAVSKMSALHFPSIELYARRLVQMGEHPERVFPVGALGIDALQRLGRYDRAALSAETGLDFSRPVALMTYHPVTLDSYEAAGSQIRTILEVLAETDLQVLITHPNADPGGLAIYQVIEGFIKRYPERMKLFASLGQRRYISAMAHAAMMIGNSSSGILESASFQLPVVNIGDRQAGRLRPENVLDVPCEANAIRDAIAEAASPEFKAGLKSVENPYGDGKTVEKIVKHLKNIDFDKKSVLLKKGFYDVRTS